MRSKSKLLLVSVVSLLILAACSTPPQATPSPTTPAKVVTQTPPPTPGSKAYTATPPAATQAPAPPLASIQMMNAETGWAWSTDGQLLRTADGGETWVDRTPQGYQFTDRGFFLDAQTGWLPVFLPDSNRFGLLYTSDGGQSWLQYPQGPATGLHFTDLLNGWAVSGDVGAGNVYYSLSQTSDGGKTWAPIPALPASPEPGLAPGTIHLCNICNDAFYYAPGRMIIVYGDLGSMEPSGAVHMEVSFDLGVTWHKQDLPLPVGEADALVSPATPIFLSAQDGLLPVHLLKTNPDGSFAEQKLAFYATHDGGAGWSLLPKLLDAIPMFTSIQVASPQDIFIVCGNTLCASHEGAQTWQTVSSDLDFTTTDTRSISALDFIDANTGWVLIMQNETTSLHTTRDGGAHWTEILPMLAAAAPPTVRVDTSIPTPTALPTDTPEPTATPGVVYDPLAQADRVTFPPYATWVELEGTLSANGAKRYVLSALQYQTMSVSIRQGPPFTVEVAGADKKTLTNANNPQFYWRGGLPSTQDYYVTVKSQTQGPFTLRIAINPPGLARQFFEYVDPQYHVLLDYSDEFAPVTWQLPFITKSTPLFNLDFIEPSYYYPTTNLLEAGLVLTASTDPGIVSTCLQPSDQIPEKVTGEVTVKGYTFTRSEAAGAAAGNEYDQVFYRTVSNNTCFEVIFLIHSGNIGNYPAGTVVEFDLQRLLHKFEEVLGAFTVK